jgi:hypothetical protein
VAANARNYRLAVQAHAPTPNINTRTPNINTVFWF